MQVNFLIMIKSDHVLIEIPYLDKLIEVHYLMYLSVGKILELFKTELGIPIFYPYWVTNGDSKGSIFVNTEEWTIWVNIFIFQFLVINIETNCHLSFLQYISVPNPSSLCFMKMLLFSYSEDIRGNISHV